MGFLDKTERVLDIVLTREGRRQLSEGHLDFRYFVLFDDEVDYDPYVANSGSLTEDGFKEARQALTEDTLVFEAIHGRLITEVSDADHTLGPRSPLFDMPQGQTILPKLAVVPDVTSSIMSVTQAVVSSHGPKNRPAAALRQKPTVSTFELDVKNYFDDSLDQGVWVRLFTSGSEGLREVIPARDYLNEYSYGLHVKVAVDELDATVKRKASRGEGDTEV